MTDNTAINDLDNLKRYCERNATSITALIEHTTKLDERLKALETIAQARAIAEAREDERDKNLYKELDAIKLEIKSIKGLGGKALWVASGAIILAVVKFVLTGGLAP